MKNFQFLIIGLCLLLSSCYTVNYIGDRLTPTTSVDIYYSEHDVTKGYKVIGHMTCLHYNQDRLKATFIKYAKSIGADAVVITGSTVDTNGKTGSDVVNADALKYN